MKTLRTFVSSSSRETADLLLLTHFAWPRDQDIKTTGHLMETLRLFEVS